MLSTKRPSPSPSPCTSAYPENPYCTALLEAGTGPAAALFVAWALPALPASRTVTLALPAAGGIDALAADGSTLTGLAPGPDGAISSRAQVIKVPIQYGSSN